MTALLAALFAPVLRLLTGDGEHVYAHGRTRSWREAKPSGGDSDHLGVSRVGGGARRLHRFVSDVVPAAQGWAAAAVDGDCPAPAAAPLLSAFVGGSAPPPAAPVVAVGRAIGEATARLVDAVAVRFGDGSAQPREAQMAARLFVASLALATAGLLAVASLAAPRPAVHLDRLAAVVNLGDAEPATADPIRPASSVDATTAAPAPATPQASTELEASVGAPEAQTATAPAEAPAAPPAPARGALPIGKGMWIWMEDRADGGDVGAIVARARSAGLTHLYVRTGTLRGGFVGGPFLDRLLPVAHANGLRVYGWDFPYLDRPAEDVYRALAAINHTTPDGHRIDGFSADIESTHEGVNNDVEFVRAYSTWLRANVGPGYPLIATVPNPTEMRLRQGFPYHAIIPSFDAVAPMVYWMNRDPATDAAHAVTYLSQWNKPVLPIGQAYDGGPEGGPPGVPNREAIIRFMQSAEGAGAVGVSFWSYQHATQEAWDAVRDAAEFRLDLGGPAAEGLNLGMVRAYQLALSGRGFPLTIDGTWGPSTIEAIRAYQAAAGLPLTGRIDEATRSLLLAPVAAPVVPDGHEAA